MMGEPHYISVLRRPGSQILVRSTSLAEIVLMTGEGIEIKAQALRGAARGSDTYRIRLRYI